MCVESESRLVPDLGRRGMAGCWGRQIGVWVSCGSDKNVPGLDGNDFIIDNIEETLSMSELRAES